MLPKLHGTYKVLNRKILRRQRKIDETFRSITALQGSCDHPDEYMRIINRRSEGYAEPVEFSRICKCGGLPRALDREPRQAAAVGDGRGVIPVSPVYEYECSICGKVIEEIRCIAARDELPLCYCIVDKRTNKGVAMGRVLSPTRGNVKNPAAGPRRMK